MERFDRRPAILYAGRLTQEKGVSMLERIGSQLYRRRRAHRFIIAGEGPLSGELRHAIPDAVFMGQLPQDQLATAMASADVLVFPSTASTGGRQITLRSRPESSSCSSTALTGARSARPRGGSRPAVRGRCRRQCSTRRIGPRLVSARLRR